MEAANRIVDSLKSVILRVEGYKLVLRKTDPYVAITKPQDRQLPHDPRYDYFLTGFASTNTEVCIQLIFGGFLIHMTYPLKHNMWHTNLAVPTV